MAAPISKTIKDLSGHWALNPNLSDSVEPVLRLQGVMWVIRMAIASSSVSLAVRQYSGPPREPGKGPDCTHIIVVQTLAGLKGTTENRCIDNTWREHSDWIFGAVRGRSSWIDVGADGRLAVGAGAADPGLDDEHLASGWLNGESERGGPEGQRHLISHVESLDSGWTATQVWGFQMIGSERRYCRNIVLRKGDERVRARLVYDWTDE